jgi:hypothetical protein
LSNDVIVDGGSRSGGERFTPLYELMIDEVIIWSGFRSISTDRDPVFKDFLNNEDSILFETVLYPGNAAVCIADPGFQDQSSAKLKKRNMSIIQSQNRDFDIHKCPPRPSIDDDAI